MAEKVRAAVEARTQPEFVIIARTGARRGGPERSLQRGGCTARPGPTLFIEALTSRQKPKRR
jgi:2-methylisocitrate lyase-like PEP mutase family enzyme